MPLASIFLLTAILLHECCLHTSSAESCWAFPTDGSVYDCQERQDWRLCLYFILLPPRDHSFLTDMTPNLCLPPLRFPSIPQAQSLAWAAVLPEQILRPSPTCDPNLIIYSRSTTHNSSAQIRDSNVFQVPLICMYSSGKELRGLQVPFLLWFYFIFETGHTMRLARKGLAGNFQILRSQDFLAPVALKSKNREGFGEMLRRQCTAL